MNSKKSISFIGAGNVATHIAQAFHDKGHVIDYVFSQNLKNAEILANNIQAAATENITDIINKSSIVIVCIKDDAIISVLEQFEDKNCLIAHTSGNINMDVFAQNGFSNYGIFYPLQTFSKDKPVDISAVPFCIEANSNLTETALFDLASSLSNNVQLINSDQRKKLHLAAVFACNFSNYMYGIADDLLSKNDINFDLLKPLILETAQKISANSPKKMQTGPAIRKDEEVIKNHEEMLADMPAYKDIYHLITKNIIDKN